MNISETRRLVARNSLTARGTRRGTALEKRSTGDLDTVITCSIRGALGMGAVERRPSSPGSWEEPGPSFGWSSYTSPCSGAAPDPNRARRVLAIYEVRMHSVSVLLYWTLPLPPGPYSYACWADVWLSYVPASARLVTRVGGCLRSMPICGESAKVAESIESDVSARFDRVPLSDAGPPSAPSFSDPCLIPLSSSSSTSARAAPPNRLRGPCIRGPDALVE